MPRSRFNLRRKPRPLTRAPAPRRTIDVRIEKLIYGGEGLAHHEGGTVFVPFVLPSEHITAETIEQRKNFMRAQVERVIEPSPERASAPCPHFGTCGGCDYQHISYEAQLRYKAEILRETLRRLGKIEWTGEIRTHASEPWHYRNRAQWKIRPVAGDRPADASTEPGIGYFRARSTSLCAVHDCPILAPALLETLFAVRDALAAGALPPTLREIEAFTNEAPGHQDPRVLLTLTLSGFPPGAAEHAKHLQSIVPGLESLLFHDPAGGRMELFGPGFIYYPAVGRAYRVGHFSFFQVNRFLAEDLAREVVVDERGELALDLFAGVGLFALPLAETFARVIAVEANPAAASDLKVNARNSPAVEVTNADVGEFLETFRGAPGLVVVDPPRAGFSRDIVRRIAEISPPRITYVACEPPTLARDLRGLLDSGYEISEVHLVDLFPQTFHMESVVRLERS